MAYMVAGSIGSKAGSVHVMVQVVREGVHGVVWCGGIYSIYVQAKEGKAGSRCGGRHGV